MNSVGVRHLWAVEALAEARRAAAFKPHHLGLLLALGRRLLRLGGHNTLAPVGREAQWRRANVADDGVALAVGGDARVEHRRDDRLLKEGHVLFGRVAKAEHGLVGLWRGVRVRAREEDILLVDDEELVEACGEG